MVTTADHDDRVVPAHSFKFAARLQACQAGNRPALIRIEKNAGHGAGKPTSKILDEQADKWAFMLDAMNVPLPHSVKPNPTPVHIGFEDEHLLVAWKPHGILTSGNSGSTFDRTLNRTRTDLSEGGVLPCHRLDFGTSGWVVLGKPSKPHERWGLLFEQRRVTKRYVALVLGKVPQSMALMWPLDGKTLCTGRTAGHGNDGGCRVREFGPC